MRFRDNQNFNKKFIMSILLQHGSCHARMDNITPLEACSTRPVITEATKQIHDLFETTLKI